jgi:glycine/D-amino acid oxidase-like deaminating enzyme
VTAEQSLWAATAPPAPDLPALEASVAAEVAVIGAGYTGLSAAVHLAEAGRDVLVLEAHEPGWGASGRNGGQVIPGLKLDPDEIEARFGASAGAALVRTVGAGPDLVFELISRFSIDCTPVRAGWIQAASSAAALPALERRVRDWQRRGAEVELLDAAALRRLTGTRAYAGGWLDRRGGTVQPLAYARGLAAAARAQGARLYARSRALSLVADPPGWRIGTARGEVRARQVLIATNAYSDRLLDRLRRSVVAVRSYQVATEPLPPELRSQVLPGGQAVSDTRRLLRYFRTDAAGRLVMGTRGRFRELPPERAAASHYAAVRELFPALAGVRYEFHWGGLVAITADHLPHLHELAPGLFAALGYNGRGVAMATMMGRLLAQQAMGRTDPSFAYPLSPLRPLPLHVFNRLAVRALIQYYRIRDRLDAASA